MKAHEDSVTRGGASEAGIPQIYGNDEDGELVTRSDAFRVTHISGKGRGVEAARLIKRGEEVERSPCIRCPMEEYAEHGRHTIFEHYFYTGRSGAVYLPLGIGCLFNHSEDPNIDFRLSETRNEIRYFAAHDIPCGQELCIYYGANLWFDNAESGAPTEANDDGAGSEVAPLPCLDPEDFPKPSHGEKDN